MLAKIQKVFQVLSKNPIIGGLSIIVSVVAWVRKADPLVVGILLGLAFGLIVWQVFTSFNFNLRATLIAAAIVSIPIIGIHWWLFPDKVKIGTLLPIGVAIKPWQPQAPTPIISNAPRISDTDLATPFGALVPAGIPNSRIENIRKGANNDELLFCAGTFKATVNPTAPYPLVVLRSGTTDLITVNGDPRSGKLRLSATVFNEDNTVAFKLFDSKFQASPKVFVERTDRGSTLIVTDDHNHRLLVVRYLNRITITLEGVFRTPGRPTIFATKNGIRIGSLDGGGLSGSIMKGFPHGPLFKLNDNGGFTLGQEG